MNLMQRMLQANVSAAGSVLSHRTAQAVMKAVTSHPTAMKHATLSESLEFLSHTTKSEPVTKFLMSAAYGQAQAAVTEVLIAMKEDKNINLEDLLGADNVDELLTTADKRLAGEEVRFSIQESTSIENIITDVTTKKETKPATSSKKETKPEDPKPETNAIDNSLINNARIITKPDTNNAAGTTDGTPTTQPAAIVCPICGTRNFDRKQSKTFTENDLTGCESNDIVMGLLGRTCCKRCKNTCTSMISNAKNIAKDDQELSATTTLINNLAAEVEKKEAQEKTRTETLASFAEDHEDRELYEQSIAGLRTSIQATTKQWTTACKKEEQLKGRIKSAYSKIPTALKG